MSAFNNLMEFARDTQALGEVAGRLGWDQETVMPRGGRAATRRGNGRDGEDPPCAPQRSAYW